MKNKKFTYFLLLGTLCLWGFIFYKIFSNKSPSVDNFQTDIANGVSMPSNDEFSDTFILNLDYPDPFLKSNASIITKKRHLPNNSNPKTEAAENIKKNKSNVEYFGLVKNNATNRKVAVLVIDGEEYPVKVGTTAKGFSVKSLTKDQIVLKDADSSMLVVNISLKND